MLVELQGALIAKIIALVGRTAHSLHLCTMIEHECYVKNGAKSLPYPQRALEVQISGWCEQGI